eukprot:3208112-Pyramimonas_sp.AAC.1
MRFTIKDEHVQRWTSAPQGFRDELHALQTKRNEMYRDMFVNVAFLSPNYDGNEAETAIVPAVAEPGAEFDTLAALKEAHAIKWECVSKIAGASIMITEERAIFFHSQKDRVLPATKRDVPGLRGERPRREDRAPRWGQNVRRDRQARYRRKPARDHVAVSSVSLAGAPGQIVAQDF